MLIQIKFIILSTYQYFLQDQDFVDIDFEIGFIVIIGEKGYINLD